MESCVKNCGSLVHDEIANAQFMEELRDMVKNSTDENIKNKVLELLQTWGMGVEAYSAQALRSCLPCSSQSFHQMLKRICCALEWNSLRSPHQATRRFDRSSCDSI